MALFRRIANLFRRTRLDEEIAAELKAHIEMRIEENLARGMSPQQARREAQVQFGNAAATRERVAGADAALTLSSIAADVRYALRQFRNHAGFGATTVLVLALGFGACVTIFAFVDAALLKPLPYREPSRLVALFESMSLGPRFHISYQDYLDWKRMNQVFTSLDVYDGATLALKTADGTEPVDGATVSDGFFRTLGVKPLLGRDFSTGEDLASAPRTVLLSYGAWMKRFGGRGDAVGKVVTLGDAAYTIIGVLPADFHFAPVEPADFWITLHAEGGCAKERGCHNYSGIARLKDGVGLQQAQANLESVADKLASEYPDADAHRGATVLALSELVAGNMRPILLTLLAGAGLLLLIACVNVSSLLLVRGQIRKREIAVRGAIGASPARIIRQLMTEGALLVAGGVGLAMILARLAMGAAPNLLPANVRSSMPYLEGLGLNLHVAVFAFLLSLGGVVLFCLLPAIRLSRAASAAEMCDALATGGRGLAGTAWRRLGRHLVIAELAVAMVLLAGAGLMSKSLFRLLHVNIGMDPAHLVAVRISAPKAGYPKDPDVVALQQRVAAELATLPAVQGVGISLRLPVGTAVGSTTFRVIGRPYHDERIEVLNREVDPGYFPTIGARLLRGRNFTREDDASHPQVMIINRAMAAEYFPGEDPVGQKIAYDATSAPKEIVGVLDDVQEGPLDDVSRPALYVPVAQETWDRFYAVVRTTLPEDRLAATLRGAVMKIDANLAISPVESMSQRISDSPAAYLHRSSAWVAGGFAGMALLLGVVGIYGVIAYSVSQRTREIGVRIALGAQRRAVYRMILLDAGQITAIGIACGAVCAVCAATLMRKLLFDVAPWDAATLAAISAMLAVFALTASFLPAHRAASIDPTQALRNE